MFPLVFIDVTHNHNTCRKSPELLEIQVNKYFTNYKKTKEFPREVLIFHRWNFDQIWQVVHHLELRISTFSISTNLTSYFLTLTAGFSGVRSQFFTVFLVLVLVLYISMDDLLHRLICSYVVFMHVLTWYFK